MQILNQHNALRAKVAKGQQYGYPPASNMNQLTWSAELAKIAQRWADQCPTYHDRNRRSPQFRHQPGQNIAYSWSSVNKPQWEFEQKIQNWYDEFENFPVENVRRFSSQGANGTIGHFTQLIWAETYLVGCGAIYHNDEAFPKHPYKKILICNYYPPGNFYGSPVFLPGSPGSRCGKKGSKNGLCLP